ncbi:MAG: hypothetical protein JW860_13665 [Sedimentisphaerales bacterium]|nr:hypothetical protein [Sedimentisphaerales bacterium]
MKKLFMLLLMLTLGLCIGSNAQAQNLLLNTGFDDGGSGNFCAPGADLDYWTDVGCNGWIHSDTVGGLPRFQGVQTFKIYATDTSVYQDVAVSAGFPYVFSVEILSPTAPNPWGGSDQLTGGRDAIIIAQWLDGSAVQIGADVIVARFVGGVDPDDTWYPISGSATAPTGAASVRFRLTIDDVSSSVGAPNYENASLVLGVDPDKAVGGLPNGGFTNPGGFANPDTTTELTWTNPSNTPSLTQIYLDQGPNPEDPNIDTAPLYDSCTDACESSAVTLTEGNYYLWRVVCDGNPSAVWAFNTVNTAPATSAGPDENAWLVSGEVVVTLSGSADDNDGYPGDPLTYNWTQTGGTTMAMTGETTLTPEVTFTAAGSYIFQLEADDGVDSATDDVTITVYAEADDRLVAHWSFEDNLLATVGTGIDGSAAGTNPIAYNSGVVGQALELDGTNYVEIASSVADPNILHYSDEITVSAWVRANVAGTFGPQFSGVVTKGDSSWRVAIDGGGQSAEFSATGVGNNQYGAISGVQVISDSNWHHVVGVVNGSQIQIYIDGVLDNAEDITDPIDKNEFGVFIGNNAEEPARRINARIDEVRIFDKGLSAARVLALYAGDGGGAACGQNYADTDFNHDCRTDEIDLLILATGWLDCTDLTGVNCN